MTKLINIILLLALLGGVGFLLYPTASDQYTQFQNARSLTAYARRTESMDSAEYQDMLDSAAQYNESLQGIELKDAFGEASRGTSAAYVAQLNPNGDGIMGIIEIPKLGCRLPIYHGTDSYGLERGAGHMEGTSLPVGGASTHCGLAGHRALPTARLFTDLDQMELGDLFYIDILNEVLVYQVDQILTVLPHELEHVEVEEGRDLVTLVTCTPYGVNTHRLLVRGTRVQPADIADQLARTDTARPLAAWQSAAIVAVPVALVCWLFLAITAPRPRRHKPESTQAGKAEKHKTTNKT